MLLLDHFDSFTFNLAQGLVEAGADITVRRVDETTLEAAEAAARASDLLVLGPGPGRPEAAALALALAFGGAVGRAPEPVHGKACALRHDGRGLFAGLPDPLTVGRYHSLTVTALPAPLEPCAWAEDGTLQALRHPDLPLAGLQFHPDSFLTPQGGDLLRHALALRH